MRSSISASFSSSTYFGVTAHAGFADFFDFPDFTDFYDLGPADGLSEPILLKLSSVNLVCLTWAIGGAVYTGSSSNSI